MSEQYRAKATEYARLAVTANSPGEANEFLKQEQNLSQLADNEQWLTDNYNKTIHAPAGDVADDASLAADEEHILRCLGAALIAQWKTLPSNLQRKLFDSAGTMGERLDAGALRGQIARFLHKH